MSLKRFFPLTTGIGVLLLSGFIHGRFTDRWSKTDAVERAVARLEKVPARFGDWQSDNLPPLEERQIQKAGIAGYCLRRYSNPTTGQAFTVFLVSGPAGQISVHTPDVCYQGAGFEMVSGPVMHRLPLRNPGESAEIWTARFRRREGPVPTLLQITWTWSARGAWQAPDNPRLAFAGSPSLYKLYAIREIGGEAADESDPGSDFLTQLLPALNRALFAGAVDVSSAATTKADD